MAHAVSGAHPTFRSVTPYDETALCVSVVNVCSAGLFQTLVPTEMQGRVFAVRSSISQAAAPVSLALVGAVSSTIAPHTLLLVGGVLVAVGGLLGYAVPGLSRAE
ncbi:MAG TPA: hypothetical protein VIK93_10530 [Limnochordales bacterium]